MIHNNNKSNHFICFDSLFHCMHISDPCSIVIKLLPHLCLSVCSQDYSKTTDQILMKFYGMVGHNLGNQSIRFE